MTTTATSGTAVSPANDSAPAAAPRGQKAPARTGPAWTRPALWVLLAGTALLYLWDLGASRDANSFYAAAVQAGSQSWEALLFGSLDPSGFITVDKPPAALWVMGLSAHVFGYSSWSMLVPQALEGVAAVALLAAAVRRTSGPVAGLVAGAALALTPAAALIFRFNNPDALVVLLLVAGAYCVVRALEAAGTRWLLLAGVAIGVAFLTKMLQGFLVLPAFTLVHLLAAPTSLRRRVVQLLGAGAAVLVSAGWFVALVELWPASSRPYIGGSTNNSLWELAVGYNGLGRILGGDGAPGGGGGPGGGAAGTSFGGTPGLSRLFSNEFGNEASWLLPAALVALVGGLWLTRRAPRTDRGRAALVLWGGWVLVTGAVLSWMSGTIHPYYTVALAPGIAALVAVGGREAWRHRATWGGRGWMAALVVAAGAWSFVLLARDASWHPELRWAVAVLTALAVLGLLLPPRVLRRSAAAVLVASVVSGLTGTAAFAVATAASPHTGSIPSVGPASAASAGTAPTGRDTEGDRTSAAVTALLQKTSTRWAAAVIGDQSAAELELASGTAVMAIGGWSGRDPTPTLAQFHHYVSSGQVPYFIAGGGARGGAGGPGGDEGGVGSQITSWVQQHSTASTVGGQTVYDLASAAG